ncbi:MAG: hypothetical protein CMM02_01695 [Rhodopirellula sp.]|nr:hypothetical protein [Rhodopirellula sp.]
MERRHGVLTPLFLTAVPDENHSWIDLAALAPNTALDEVRMRSVQPSQPSHASICSCESEEMCTIEEAAAASPTRAPILGTSKPCIIYAKKDNGRAVLRLQRPRSESIRSSQSA